MRKYLKKLEKLDPLTKRGLIGLAAGSTAVAISQIPEGPADFFSGLAKAVADNPTAAVVTTTALSSTTTFFAANLVTAAVQAYGRKALRRDAKITTNKKEYVPLLSNSPTEETGTCSSVINTPPMIGALAQILTAAGVGIAGIWTSEAYQAAWSSLLANQTMNNATYTAKTWAFSSVAAGLTSFELTILVSLLVIALSCGYYKLEYLDTYPEARFFASCRRGKSLLPIDTDETKLVGGLPTDAETTDQENNDPEASAGRGYQSERPL